MPAVGEGSAKLGPQLGRQLLDLAFPIGAARVDAVSAEPLLSIRVPAIEHRFGNRVDRSPSDEANGSRLRPMRQLAFDDGEVRVRIKHLQRPKRGSHIETRARLIENVTLSQNVALSLRDRKAERSFDVVRAIHPQQPIHAVRTRG